MMKSVSFSEVCEVCLSHFGPIFALMFVQKRIINVQRCRSFKLRQIDLHSRSRVGLISLPLTASTWTLTCPKISQLLFIGAVPSEVGISSSTSSVWWTSEHPPGYCVDSMSAVYCLFYLMDRDHSVSCHCVFLCVLCRLGFKLTKSMRKQCTC